LDCQTRLYKHPKKKGKKKEKKKNQAMDMLESLLGVGLKFNHLSPKRFGGVSALLRISLLATRFFFSPGTTYPWRAHRTEPGRFAQVQAGLDRGTTAKYPPLCCPSLKSPTLCPEKDIFGESSELSAVCCWRVSCIFPTEEGFENCVYVVFRRCGFWFDLKGRRRGLIEFCFWGLESLTGWKTW